jgi:hypothetical protein
MTRIFRKDGPGLFLYLSYCWKPKQFFSVLDTAGFYFQEMLGSIAEVRVCIHNNDIIEASVFTRARDGNCYNLSGTNSLRISSLKACTISQKYWENPRCWLRLVTTCHRHMIRSANDMGHLKTPLAASYAIFQYGSRMSSFLEMGTQNLAKVYYSLWEVSYPLVLWYLRRYKYSGCW